MLPYYHLFGLRLPMYGLMAVLGGLLAFVVVFLRIRRYAAQRDDAVNLFVLCVVGALVGAKLLFFLTALPNAVNHWGELMNNPLSGLNTLFGGLVFYGGVLGALGASALYIKKYRLSFRMYADLFAPAIPAGHMLGRIGCFLSGCCYGVPVPWGLTTVHSVVIEADGVPRVPVQLIEAGCNLIICLVLLLFERRKKTKPGRVFALYLLLYAALRFVLEFFRGDILRGVYFDLSTSQWLSLALFTLGMLLFFEVPLYKSRRSV